MGHKRRKRKSISTKVQNKWLQRAVELIRIRGEHEEPPPLHVDIACAIQRAYREGLADGHEAANESIDEAISALEEARP